MPSDLFKRIDLDLLYPPFLEKLLAAVAACRIRGATYVATSGYRSFTEQSFLRLAFLKGQGGRAAPAGFSAHQYGLAVDFVRDTDATAPGVQPDWRTPAYAELGEESAKVGLVWGGGFGDAPHVQWPGFVTAAELKPLMAMWGAEPHLALAARLSRLWAGLPK